VDGTLARTDIVGPLHWYKQRLLSGPGRLGWLGSLAWRLPWWWTVDQFSRRASNISIYRAYRGLSASETRQLAQACYEAYLQPRIFPGAREHLDEFRQAGARVVLVTGSLDFLMAPMARELDADCIAPALEERAGIFTGRMKDGPLTGPGKAAAIQEDAARHGCALQDCYALGDAIGDLQMLEAVGHPVAVNPDRRLAEVARSRGWRIEQWKR
jgi:alcohol-forming fatty acyl-CoA reductase